MQGSDQHRKVMPFQNLKLFVTVMQDYFNMRRLILGWCASCSEILILL